MSLTGTCRIAALCWYAQDPSALADFWGGLLFWQVHDGYREALDPRRFVELLPNTDTGTRLRFHAANQQSSGTSGVHHVHLSSRSHADHAQTLKRALHLGALETGMGSCGEDDHDALVDPEGNEFCVMQPQDSDPDQVDLLAGVAFDGSATAARFWSNVLGWPLSLSLYDERLLLHPSDGAVALSWSGEAESWDSGQTCAHFDLEPSEDTTQANEVARLRSLGAERGADNLFCGVGLLDPDGAPFFVAPTP